MGPSGHWQVIMDLHSITRARAQVGGLLGHCQGVNMQKMAQWAVPDPSGSYSASRFHISGLQLFHAYYAKMQRVKM